MAGQRENHCGSFPADIIPSRVASRHYALRFPLTDEKRRPPRVSLRFHCKMLHLRLPLTSSFLLEYSSEHLNEYSITR